MMKGFERVTTADLDEAATRLLFGEWVQRPPDTLTLKEVREDIKDVLELTTVLGAVGRTFLKEDISDPRLAERFAVEFLRAGMRLYAGALKYGFSVEIPEEVLDFLHEEEGEQTWQAGYCEP